MAVDSRLRRGVGIRPPGASWNAATSRPGNCRGGAGAGCGGRDVRRGRRRWHARARWNNRRLARINAGCISAGCALPRPSGRGVRRWRRTWHARARALPKPSGRRGFHRGLERKGGDDSRRRMECDWDRRPRIASWRWRKASSRRSFSARGRAARLRRRARLLSKMARSSKLMAPRSGIGAQISARRPPARAGKGFL